MLELDYHIVILGKVSKNKCNLATISNTNVNFFQSRFIINMFFVLI